jgi:DNA-binding SARP family transcriptional activator
MEFRILGSIEARVDGAPIALRGTKPRALLARLLIDAGRAVPIDRIVDDLWGERVPESAVKMVQIHVSALRKVLAPGVLTTRPPGYALDVAPESIDAVRSARLRVEGSAALAAGDPRTASARLSEALALWHGHALADLGEPIAAVERASLEGCGWRRSRSASRPISSWDATPTPSES